MKPRIPEWVAMPLILLGGLTLLALAAWLA